MKREFDNIIRASAGLGILTTALFAGRVLAKGEYGSYQNYSPHITTTPGYPGPPPTATMISTDTKTMSPTITETPSPSDTPIPSNTPTPKPVFRARLPWVSGDKPYVIPPTQDPRFTPRPTPRPTWEHTFRLCFPVAVMERNCNPKTQGIDIMMVIDSSGSMGSIVYRDDNYNRLSKLDYAAEGVRGMVQLTRPNDQFGLVAFQSSAQLMQTLTNDRQSMLNQISQLNAGGGTEMQPGILEAEKELAGPRHRMDNEQIMVVLSDGQTGGPNLTIEEASKAKELGIRIFTVGYSSDSKGGADLDEDLLRKVSSGPHDYAFADTTQIAPVLGAMFYSAACCRPQGGTDINLTIDASTSMDERMSDGHTKLEAAKEAAEILFNQIAPGEQASLVSFNEDAHLLQGLTGDRRALISALDKIALHQYTRIDLGLQRSVQELLSPRHKKNNRPVLVLLTDGRSNPVPASVAVDRAREAKELGIRVVTIGLGQDIDLEALMQMANQPSDFYASPPSAAELALIYRQIGFRLSCDPTYWPRTLPR